MTSLTFWTWRRHKVAADPLPHAASAGRAPWLVTLAAAGWMATACNLALWAKLGDLGLLHGLRGLLLGLGCAGIISALIVTLVSLLAWRWTLKPVLTLLLVTAAAAMHFMRMYGIVIDPSMVVNVLQTDAHEAGDLLSLRLVLTLGVAGLLPALLLWRTPVRYGTPGRRALGNLGLFVASLAVAAGLLLACFQPLSSLMRNHKDVRYLINPLNAVWAVADVAAKPLRRAEGPLQPIGEDAVLGTLPGAAALGLSRQLDEHGPSWHLQAEPTEAGVTAALQPLALALRAAGRCGPWRNEQLAVVGTQGQRGGGWIG